MSRVGRELDVLLGNVPVGRLALDAGGQAAFVFFEGYRARYPRPVLGQMFEDDLFGRYVGKSRLPVWFSNLLPEGPLRNQVQNELGGRRNHEIFLFAGLGEDLPGAVQIVPASDPAEGDVGTIHEAEARVRALEPKRIRFSLAGMQTKFPVLRSEDGSFGLPPRGVLGDWIAKLPHKGLPGVTINEHAMMTWASLSGLDVPPVELVSPDNIEGIELKRFVREEPAFVIRRFDRAPGGQRIHIEDMAQVLGIYPDNKYDERSHYKAIGRVVRAVTGLPGFDELVRRLVFMIASGNADMHHKNWSLRYPDGVHAQLAPSYDLVATIVYSDSISSDEIALKLAGSRRWEKASLASFMQLADESGVDGGRTKQIVEQTVEAIVASRAEARARTRMPAEAWDQLAAHWKRVPLLHDRI